MALVSAVDGEKGGVAHGAQCEGIGCFHGRGAIQCAWIAVGSPLPGVQTVCCTRIPAWVLHNRPSVFYLCCIVLCYHLSGGVLCVPGLCPELLIQSVCCVASGDSRPGGNRRGVNFRVRVQVPWNAPESVVTWDSPGVAVLDTSHVPDVLDLKACDAHADVIRVLTGTAQDSVRILIPDTNVVACGFHDVTLGDMFRMSWT